jgi:hypothetical protein
VTRLCNRIKRCVKNIFQVRQINRPNIRICMSEYTVVTFAGHVHDRVAVEMLDESVRSNHLFEVLICVTLK